MEEPRKSIFAGTSDYCKLNVGGTLHYTTVATLTKTDSMLRAMFNGRNEVLKDDDGWVIIDRCGKHFGTILNFLRDASVPLPENKREIQELLIEAKYYLIQDLISICELALEKWKEDKIMDSICSVPLIKSKQQENMLLTTLKPAVKLIINRHNNKYSYTSTSDENLLKNLDLFDKLSLKFSNRVLFMKDIVCSNEICCWSFYGNGKKDAEICCTSIVYATDKKHTKVEFPEARIYEEMLNILLYENKTSLETDSYIASSITTASTSTTVTRNSSGGGGFILNSFAAKEDDSFT
ncbi:hypothetical protein RDWZM_005188 [Blomia tropicalis]|uniref:BTB domain-containing protein n=1 Tax=Blomia tropicalis TaxID=40697 RepID=A0A9Q0M4Z3_BLOTA|nr:BTB/POZ domain-containing adapter for CUL3-mediated RhoA degradation protein 3 [Blomia tropicalis]KAJ6219376.1 hypothetical protein RDWZM_005188 [Blomia tropicalis]